MLLFISFGDIFQPFENKANKLKEEYNKAMKVYKESGGGASSSGSREKSEKHESKKSKSKASVSPTKSGTGPRYVSKEFIEDDDTSSDSGAEKVSKILKFGFCNYFSLKFSILICRKNRNSSHLVKVSRNQKRKAKANQKALRVRHPKVRAKKKKALKKINVAENRQTKKKLLRKRRMRVKVKRKKTNRTKVPPQAMKMIRFFMLKARYNFGIYVISCVSYISWYFFSS